MWEMLLKQLGLKPEIIKPQIEETIATVKKFDEKLDRIIILLETIIERDNVSARELIEKVTG